MTQIFINIAFGFAILMLFLLDRETVVRTSKGLWVPVMWLLIAASRPVSMWMGATSSSDSPDRYLEGSPIDRAVLGMLVAAGIAILFRRRRAVSALLRANAPILCFFFYCALSILWSEYPEVAFKRSIRGLGDLAMVLVLLTEAHRWVAVRRLFAWTGFILLPLSVLLIRYYPDWGRQYNREWDWMYTGVSMQKNELGVICAIVGLASLWRLLEDYRTPRSKQRTRHMVAHGALLATVAWLLWMANSVTATSCCVIGASLMLTLSLWKVARRPMLVHSLILSTMLIPFAVLFLNMHSDVLGAMGRNTTLTGRTEVWSRVQQLVTNPVFGTGYESFWLGKRLAIMTETDSALNQAHNGYLEIFLNLGWVGIGLLAILILTGYRNAIGLFRLDPGKGRLMLAFFVITVSYNFTEAGFKMMSPIWICFLIATFARPEWASRRASTKSIQPKIHLGIADRWQQEESAGAEVT